MTPCYFNTHTARVCSLSECFAWGMDLSEKHTQILLDAAAWHDCKKEDEKRGLCKRHNKAAAKMIIARRSVPHLRRVADVVRNHRGTFDPEERNWKMAAILRLCDKLDKFDKGDEDAAKKCKKCLRQIQDWCYENDLLYDDDWIQLKSIFKVLLKLKKQGIL